MTGPIIYEPTNNTAVCAADPSHSGCAASYLTFISFVTQYLGKSNDNYPPVVDNDGTKRDEYDFIIVGAGSAGCVLANRLSEISDWKILLLEAGPNEPAVGDVPSFSVLLRASNVDWNYRTQPGKSGCLAKRNKGCPWPRGKSMGGSSSVNSLIYIRGHPSDYDHWADLGNPGWSYKEVLPYFIKSENNRNPEVVAANPEYHGVGGYQDVEYFPYTDPNTNILLNAFEEIGYEPIDANGRHHVGSTRYQFISRDGQRQSTNGAFIRPVINQRANLTLKTGAYVTKLKIDPKTKVAFGVEYDLRKPNGKIKRLEAYAKREVIVSAGAINSPKLLMLSGIGPRAELEKLNVDLIQDLAVGRNLQDHPTLLGLMVEMKEQELQTLATPEKWIEDTKKYMKKVKGPLTAMGVLSSGAFLRTHLEKVNDRPDVQVAFDSLNLTDYVAIGEDAEGTAMVPVAYYTGIVMRPQILAPRSRGYLVLNATDPQWSSPLIYPRYFEDPLDLEVLVAGIRICRKLYDTEAFKDHGFELFTKPMPACKHLEFDSDDYWKCAAMFYTDTNYHPAGTCKMGPASDPEAVVDSQLRVHGIEALRVIDASIFPEIPRGNLNAPTIMVAEKMSDEIKKVYLEEHGVS